MPGLALLITTMGVLSGRLRVSIREEKGCTFRLVPITITRSALLINLNFALNLGGSFSPNNMMSGLTIPVAAV